MKAVCGLVVLITALSLSLLAEDGVSTVQGRNIRIHTRFLSDDITEGRAPGSRGGELAAKYIATQFELAGLSPVSGDSFFQMVPMIGSKPSQPPKLAISGAGMAPVQFQFARDFVGWPASSRPEAGLTDSQLIFVGYGIKAPEMGWDDYKGQDSKGKVLLMLVNDPPSADPSFFGGPALTYYGRWTYKFEEAARQGAAGVLLIHDTEMAGYAWQVVEASWTGERFDLPAESPQSTLFEGWIQRAKADELFKRKGLDFERAVEMAGKREFAPVDLGMTVSAGFRSDTRRIESPNVLGLLKGRDPALQNEAILITTHYDHFGIGKEVNGDKIYNGALDNASGTAGLIELARVLAASSEPPRRSVIFAAVTGEEQGLLGSAYYAAHPAWPLAQTVANINVDAINVWGRTRSMIAMGAQRSSLERNVEELAAQLGLALSPDPEPEKGGFFRSDHFSLVKVGVPAVYIRYGRDFEGKPPDWGQRLADEYLARRYHQPNDEFDPSWSFEGAEQMMELVRLLTLSIGNAAERPEWKTGDPFGKTRTVQR
ncbi:MAG: M28 family metallopeptidase [Acidobacteriota bacterium]